jgi:tetratricopeptide (TPR) repeat protein
MFFDRWETRRYHRKTFGVESIGLTKYNRRNIVMRILKIASFVLLLPVMTMYFSRCSSAEQTTAKLAYDRGDYTKAEEEFMKEVKQNPSNEEAWFYLAASRIQLEKYKDAEDAFLQYRKIGKNSFAKEIEEAWIKRYNSAADNFEKGQKVKDDNDKVKLFTSAVNDFRVCKIIIPDSTVVDQYITSISGKIAMITVNPIIDKGISYMNDGKFEDAVNEFKNALNKIDKNAPGYDIVTYNLSITYLKWGEQMRKTNDQDTTYKDKYKDAMPYLEDLTNSNDPCNRYSAYMLLVQVYANVNLSDKALDAIAKRDKLKTEHPECVKEENK